MFEDRCWVYLGGEGGKDETHRGFFCHRRRRRKRERDISVRKQGLRKPQSRKRPPGKDPHVRVLIKSIL